MTPSDAERHLTAMRSMRNGVNRVLRSFSLSGDDRRSAVARRDAIEWAIELMSTHIAATAHIATAPDTEDRPSARYDDCGSRNAAVRHRRDGERPCADCAQAERDYQRDRRQRKSRAS